MTESREGVSSEIIKDPTVTTEVRGNSRFVLPMMATVITIGGAVFMHANGQEGAAALFGTTAALQIFCTYTSRDPNS